MSRTMQNDRVGRRTWRARLGVALLALVLFPAVGFAQDDVQDKYRRNQERNSQFNLNASGTAVLRVNQYQCGLVNDGSTCTDVFDSPTGGGGFWPTGSPNQYMFNSGLQVVGIIPMGPGCTTANRASGTTADCFAWSGDTTGAFFMDAAGTRQHGTAVTDIYDSLNPDDLENWPTAGTFPDFPTASAMVEDTALFNDVLIGRKAASQQDSWVMYWDGDPVRTGGRTHPMGILVEQRTLAWNYPEGNENIIYFIYKFTNVTNNPLFQRLNETRYAIELPDEGWRFDSIYVAYDSDPDVTPDAGQNYATAILPFSVGLAYKNTFLDDDFVYPPDLFAPPFLPNAPGFIGIKYLKSPIDPATGEEVGLTSFSLHTNGGAFPDPSTVQRGWRYISLNTDPSKGDPSCTFTDPAVVRARKSCYLAQTVSDVRMFVGSGPFSLNAGESATIAVAQYAAAVVATPAIVQGNDNKPEFPSVAPGCNGNPIRAIETASGYIAPISCPAAGEQISQDSVRVVKNSLLGRGMVAQSIFDNKFLLGFAPETPPFYLVPGDNRVTVVWEPSPTEQAGDPFFAAAGDSTNALFDPNYREFDVEGYRIYRGTSPANMVLVAQFDKQGSVFVDNTCITDPEHVTGDPCGDVHEVDITHPFVQYTSVVELATGASFVQNADTALAAEIAANRGRELGNTGIPYSYVDTDVRNGFQYFYRVTAFDVNSVRSGPSSLESAGPTKSIVPRATSTGFAGAEFEFAVRGRGDGDLPSAPVTIDPVTGTFSGPMPANIAFDGEFRAFAAEMLAAGNGAAEIVIDSVTGGYYPNGVIATYYVSGGGLSGSFQYTNHTTNSSPGTTETMPLLTAPVAADPAKVAELRAQGIDVSPVAGAFTGTLTIEKPHWSAVDADWAPKQAGFWVVPVPASATAGGARWFVGANETMADPTLGDTLYGQIPGYQLDMPQPYRAAPRTMASYDGQSDQIFRRFYGTALGVQRAADVKFYWGAAGLDSVVDVTHNVRVPFTPNLKAGYGFLQDADGNGTLNYGDFYYIPGLENTANIGGYSSSDPTPLVETLPALMPTDINGNLTGDGDGFGLYVNGAPFLFVGPTPAAGEVWTLRTYSGAVTRTDGTYAYEQTISNPAVPGLRFVLNVDAPGSIVASDVDLTRVHTVPDPYYATSLFDLSPGTKELQFVNMPAEATIRIYSLSGVLVDVINHNDPAGTTVAKWDLRNRSNQFVASGVYLFHVSTPDGRSHIGKFTVIGQGFAR